MTEKERIKGRLLEMLAEIRKGPEQVKFMPTGVHGWAATPLNPNNWTGLDGTPITDKKCACPICEQLDACDMSKDHSIL